MGLALVHFQKYWLLRNLKLNNLIFCYVKVQDEELFYHGYDELLDPRITNEFIVAAYRFGHSLVTGDIP